MSPFVIVLFFDKIELSESFPFFLKKFLFFFLSLHLKSTLFLGFYFRIFLGLINPDMLLVGQH